MEIKGYVSTSHNSYYGNSSSIKWRVDGKVFNHPMGYRRGVLETLLPKIKVQPNIDSTLSIRITDKHPMANLIYYLITKNGRSGLSKEKIEEFKDYTAEEIYDWFKPKIIAQGLFGGKNERYA